MGWGDDHGGDKSRPGFIGHNGWPLKKLFRSVPHGLDLIPSPQSVLKNYREEKETALFYFAYSHEVLVVTNIEAQALALSQRLVSTRAPDSRYRLRCLPPCTALAFD